MAVAQDTDTIENITVTAERRETNLQETPIAISVISAAAIEKNETRHISDILHLTPGLSFTGIAPNQSSFGLRGLITVDDSAGTDQSTGVFVDGLYFGRTMLLNQNLIDVERVEVLRGPQGTLWGHNTVGGSIIIVTRDPTEEFSAEARATGGNFGRFDVSGRIAGPLTDNLLGQVAVALESTDGFMENLDTGNMLGQKDVLSLRTKLIWQPSDELEIRFNLGAEQNTTDGYGHVWYALNPSTSGLTPIVDVPTLQENETETRSGTDGFFDNDALAMSLQVELDLGGGLSLFSQTGYIDYEGIFDEYSFFPVPEALGAVTRDALDTSETLSQEIRLAGDSDDRLFWQLGTYYYQDETTKQEFWSQVSAVPFSFRGAAIGNFPDPQEQLVWQSVETESFAMFGQATYAVTDNMNFTLGGRYTNVRKTSMIDNSGDFSGALLIDAPGFTATGSESWSDFSPRFIVDYNLEDVGAFDSIMTYASIANGWKSGSFGQSPTIAEATVPFRPEEAWNYEAGVKMVFWDSRARANLAVFTTDYSDLQIISIRIEGAGTITENADSAISGFEADGYFSLTDWLDLSVGYTYYDSEYDDGATFEGQDIGGNRTVYTPENTYSLGAIMNWEFANDVGLNFNLNYAFIDEIFLQPTNSRFIPHPDAQKFTERSILNATLTLSWRNLDVSLWGKNLLDDEYVLQGAPFGGFWTTHIADHGAGDPSTFDAQLTAPRGEPLSYGMSVKWLFGD